MKTNNCLLAALTVLALASCSQPHQVEGTWKEGVGKTVYLQPKTDNADDAAPTDSVVVAADGTFSFDKGGVVGAYILTADGQNKGLLLSEVPVTVTIAPETRLDRDSNEYVSTAIVAEGDEQEVYAQANDLMLSSAMMDLGSMLMLSKIVSGDLDVNLDSAVLALDTIKANIAKQCLLFVDSARNNYGAAYFIKEHMIRKNTFEEISAAYENLSDRVKQSAPGLEAKAAVDALSSVSVGGIAPDVVLPTPDGAELALSSLRGHYVLIDFWASWCGPCLREAPNVKAIYEKYHDKGFEIYGISLDEDAEAWKAAIEKHGLNWHHVSSLKGWECPVAARYNVTGIPRMYILDPDGKIIAQDLRGEELAAFVASLYE